MITNNLDIQLYVEGELVDLFQEGTSIRINNTLADPTKLTASTTTYSYSFDLPLTPKNCKIFDNINVPSKKNKFNKRYKAELYSSEVLIFSGSIKIAELNNDEIKCNLYIPKMNTITDLFGDSTMNMIDWKVDYDGVDTMNAVNADMTTKYFFPYAAYALPSKKSYATTASGKYKKFTDKKAIDEYSYFYFNSFIPSLNLSELMRKCFEHKGVTLEGDIISDDILKEIYLSNYIADGQDPDYNLGNPNIGDIKFNLKFSNYHAKNLIYTKIYDNAIEWQYDEEMKPVSSNNYSLKRYTYNYDEIYAYNMLDKESVASYSGTTFQTAFGGTQISPIELTYNSNAAKMLIDGGIQIPSDGWYEIRVSGKIGVAEHEKDAYFSSFGNVLLEQAVQGRTSISRDSDSSYASVETEFISSGIPFSTQEMPYEFQLLRYRPNVDSEASSISHNMLWGGIYPNEAKLTAPQERYKNGGSRNIGTTSVMSDTALMDVYNNANYICGWMTSGEGTFCGYIKDGRSWNEDTFESNEALYNCMGYYKVKGTSARGGTYGYTYTLTDYNKNTLNGYTDYSDLKLSYDKRITSGTTKMIVKLNKNDILMPFMNLRALPMYTDQDTYVTYCASADLDFEIRAVAQPTVSRNDLKYAMESKFDKKLNLGNFCNKDEKMSDFVSNVQKAFNLSYQQNGNVVTMNLNKSNKGTDSTPINVDGRVHTSEAVFNAIDFPSKIQSSFSINKEEEGFYRSVPNSHINDNDWEEWGDTGSEPIQVSSADDAKELTQSVSFSYCWYNDFMLTDLPKLRFFNERATYKLSVPIIGKTEWWIEGYKYEEMSRNDGRGFKQRFWFRQPPYENTSSSWYMLPTNGMYDSLNVQWFQLTLPTNSKVIGNETVYLNYRKGANTILGKFFDIDFDSENEEVDIEVYLTPLEYQKIVRGATVQFDDNIYRVMKVQGFDPNGLNKTKLSLIAL